MVHVRLDFVHVLLAELLHGVSKRDRVRLRRERPGQQRRGQQFCLWLIQERNRPLPLEQQSSVTQNATQRKKSNSLAPTHNSFLLPVSLTCPVYVLVGADAEAATVGGSDGWWASCVGVTRAVGGGGCGTTGITGAAAADACCAAAAGCEREWAGCEWWWAAGWAGRWW